MREEERRRTGDPAATAGEAVAILLHGVVQRSLRHVVGSLRRNVIEPLASHGEVDVFFHSWDVEEIHNPRGGEHGVAVDTAEVARLLPEARGIFESQEAFDRTVDWELLFANNPMRHCTTGEEEARATLMNFRRALESQERAWRFFEKTKTRSYDVVVATRADLLFLEKMKSDAHRATLQDGRIWVPRFQAWGGVNDRFAMGSEEVIKVWSNRAAFADGWLLKAGGESSEWLLRKWLERNRVAVEFLDFTFQRIRANGEVAAMDRGLTAAVNRRQEAILETHGLSAKRERFLILAREAGVMTEGLRKVLAPLGKVEVIVDRPVAATDDRHPIWVTDEEAEGYGGLMSNSGPFPWITAWSRAMVHLARTLEDDEAVWFVEDDVAGDAMSFAELVTLTKAAGAELAAVDLRTRHDDSHWPQWRYADGCFNQHGRGFQPLCRVSGRLIRAALEFRERHGKFTFHEVLFASLALEAGLAWLNWSRDETISHLFSRFRYRPEVRPIKRGISHPVKDRLVHAAVCDWTDVSECGRAAFYEGGNGGGWYLEDFGTWKRMFVTDQPVKVLETGVSDGVSANLMLDELFIHPESEVHGIGLYDSNESGERTKANFETNARQGGHAGQLHLYEGYSREVLAWMIAGDGFWESFDFIHLSGSDDEAQMLADACQAWMLLKHGGILVMDADGQEEERPPDGAERRPAACAFLSVFGHRLDRLLEGKSMVVMKPG